MIVVSLIRRNSGIDIPTPKLTLSGDLSALKASVTPAGQPGGKAGLGSRTYSESGREAYVSVPARTARKAAANATTQDSPFGNIRPEVCNTYRISQS